jgi:hypothetical protein
MNRIPSLVVALLLALQANADGFEVGTLVVANYQGLQYAYVAKITSISGRAIGVKYLDDGSEETRDRAEVRKFDWKTGAKLECRWKRGDLYFPGTVRRIGDRELHFDYADGDKEATEIAMCRECVSGPCPR